MSSKRQAITFEISAESFAALRAAMPVGDRRSAAARA